MVRVWPVDNPAGAVDLTAHTAPVTCVLFLPADRLLSAGRDGIVRLWDLKTNVKRKISGLKEGVYRLVFSPDGMRLLSSGTAGVVRLWNVADGKEILTLTGHSKTVYGLGFSADGRRAVTGGADRKLRLWELPR